MCRFSRQLLLTACLLIGAVPARADANLSNLGNTFWRLARIDAAQAGKDAGVVRITNFSIDFATPCSYALYPFHYNAGILSVSRSADSALACKGSRPPLAVDFESRLRKAARVDLHGDTLTLLDGHNRSLISLTRLPPTGPENRKWQITSYFDGERLVTPDSVGGIPPYITFFGGYLDGTAGCRGLVGKYTLSGSRLTVAAGSTALFGSCPGDLRQIFQQEALVEKALSGIRYFERDGEQIVLRDDQGAVQIVLAPWR